MGKLSSRRFKTPKTTTVLFTESGNKHFLTLKILNYFQNYEGRDTE